MIFFSFPLKSNTFTRIFLGLSSSGYSHVKVCSFNVYFTVIFFSKFLIFVLFPRCFFFRDSYICMLNLLFIASIFVIFPQIFFYFFIFFFLKLPPFNLLFLVRHYLLYFSLCVCVCVCVCVLSVFLLIYSSVLKYFLFLFWALLANLSFSNSNFCFHILYLFIKQH